MCREDGKGCDGANNVGYKSHGGGYCTNPFSCANGVRYNRINRPHPSTYPILSAPTITQFHAESPNPFEAINTYKYIFNDLLLEPFVETINIGVPIYKQTKGLIPFGAVGEGIVGGLLQAGSDLSRTDLTMPQRAMRTLVVGGENAATDIVSSGGGTVAATLVGLFMIGDIVPLDEIPGAGIAFFGGMFATNFYVTQYFDNRNKIWFSEWNLGGN
jgi:hypothetical protein